MANSAPETHFNASKHHSISSEGTRPLQITRCTQVHLHMCVELASRISTDGPRPTNSGTQGKSDMGVQRGPTERVHCHCHREEKETVGKRRIKREKERKREKEKEKERKRKGKGKRSSVQFLRRRVLGIPGVVRWVCLLCSLFSLGDDFRNFLIIFRVCLVRLRMHVLLQFTEAGDFSHVFCMLRALCTWQSLFGVFVA